MDLSPKTIVFYSAKDRSMVVHNYIKHSSLDTQVYFHFPLCLYNMRKMFLPSNISPCIWTFHPFIRILVSSLTARILSFKAFDSGEAPSKNVKITGTWKVLIFLQFSSNLQWKPLGKLDARETMTGQWQRICYWINLCDQVTRILISNDLENTRAMLNLGLWSQVNTVKLL